ncbi:hypothetical protein IT414_03925 [bacterium]|nr:hypothetical protein [bacterium]
MSRLKKAREGIKSHAFFQDGWIVGFLFFSALVIAFEFIWSITHIRQTELLIPVHYTSLQNFELGKWYELYELVIISLATFLTNLALGIVLYKKSRLMAIFLLFISLLVAILSTAILFGFTSVNYGAV